MHPIFRYIEIRTTKADGSLQRRFDALADRASAVLGETVTGRYVRQIARGKRWPRRPLARALSRAADGFFTAGELLNWESPVSVSAAAQSAKHA